MVNSIIRKGSYPKAAARIPRSGWYPTAAASAGRQPWYPTAAASAGRQPSNGDGGVFNWLWLIASIIVLLIVLVLVALHVYARRRREAAGRVASGELPKPGLDSSTITTIPTFAYSKGVKSSNGHEDIKCVVCLGGVVEGDVVRELPKCKHIFHVGCIDKWLKSHATCPMCRADAEPTEEARLPLSKGGSNLEEEEHGGWRMVSYVEKQGRRVQGDEITDIERQ